VRSAFDPMETNTENPKVYFSHSFFFHGESKSSSGQAINGKISVAWGANLDNVEDIITGKYMREVCKIFVLIDSCFASS